MGISISKAIKLLRKSLSQVDFKVFSICLMLSSLIWLIMALSGDYDKEVKVAVEYKNFPEGMILINQPPKQLTVRVKSTGFKLMSKALTSVESVEIDVNNLNLIKSYGKLKSAISTNSIWYDIVSQLEFDDISKRVEPDSLHFVFDYLVSKEVPVKLNSRVKYMDGHIQYGKEKIMPSAIKLSGPASVLREIKYVETDSLILLDLNSNYDGELKLIRPYELIEMDAEDVEVKIYSEKYSQFTIKVPIIVKSNVPGLKVKTFPDKVDVVFSMALPDYKKITDSSFVVETRLDSLDLLRKNEIILHVVNKPEGAENVKLSVESVDYHLIQN